MRKIIALTCVYIVCSVLVHHALAAAGVSSTVELDEGKWPAAFVCPYCYNSMDLPAGSWSGNWSKPVSAMVFLTDPKGNSVGTINLLIAPKNVDGYVSARAVFSMVGKEFCIVEAKHCQIDEDGNLGIRIPSVKDLGAVNITISPDGLISGMAGAYMAGNQYSDVLQNNDGVGFIHGAHVFNVVVGDYAIKQKNYRLIEDILPRMVAIVTSEKTWICGKASTPKYKKMRNEDGTARYDLVGLGDESAPNVSRLTLKFNARQNTVSGTFKAYATNEGLVKPGRKPQLKTYSFSVKGHFSGDKVIGTATCKTLKASWTFMVE